MKRPLITFTIIILSACAINVVAQDTIMQDSALQNAAVTDSIVADIMTEGAAAQAEGGSVFKFLKQKYIEGNPYFMSLVALSLILGLAFCVERVIYLSMSTINTRRFMAKMDEKMGARDIEGAKELCRNTRGPVAALCLRGLERMAEPMEDIERSVINYGSVLATRLEKGCSWITLFIAIAPSLGFLGTVIGMVMAFDDISTAGDISPTIVADGMKVALITTIFGIIVAIILQVFYNYIISRIEYLTAKMEESALEIIDLIATYKSGTTK